MELASHVAVELRKHSAAKVVGGDDRVLDVIQVVLDAVALLAAMSAAKYLHGHLQHFVPALQSTAEFRLHATMVYLVAPLWFALIFVFRLHRTTTDRPGRAELLVKLFKLHLAGFVGLSVIQFLTQATINRSLVALFLLCTFALMFTQRSLVLLWADYQYRTGVSHERVLLVGQPSRRMATLAYAAMRQRHAPHFLGYLEASSQGTSLSTPPPGAPTLPRLGRLDELPRLLHDQAIDHVLFFPPVNRPELVQEQLAACEEVGVAASFSVDLVQLGQAAPRLMTKYDHSFVTFERAPKSQGELAVKYGLDPILAALGLVLLAPVFLAIAVAIWVTMGRPILFSQARGGLYGRPFRMLKFRSMRTTAEAERDGLAELNEMSGPVFKIARDPRVTALGRFLRRTSLDELPQLINVLNGTMSLVGPRPLPVQEQEQIRGWQRRRLSMKPGITCLWQVGGRNELDFSEWMLLDLRYIDEWSLWLDLQILLKTIPAVLGRRGAH